MSCIFITIIRMALQYFILLTRRKSRKTSYTLYSILNVTFTLSLACEYQSGEENISLELPNGPKYDLLIEDMKKNNESFTELKEYISTMKEMESRDGV